MVVLASSTRHASRSCGTWSTCTPRQPTGGPERQPVHAGACCLKAAHAVPPTGLSRPATPPVPSPALQLSSNRMSNTSHAKESEARSPVSTYSGSATPAGRRKHQGAGERPQMRGRRCSVLRSVLRSTRLLTPRKPAVACLPGCSRPAAEGRSGAPPAAPGASGHPCSAGRDRAAGPTHPGAPARWGACIGGRPVSAC